MGKVLSNLCFPVKGSETEKSCKHIDEEEEEKHEDLSENLEQSDSEDLFYLITPCQDINKLYSFGQLIWKSKSKKVVEATSSIGDNGEKFAVKIVDNEEAKNESLDVIQNEIETLYQLDHPNIVKFYHAYSDGSFTYMILERCNEEIFDVVPEDQARVLATKLLSALAYLHQRKICHLDIKPQNIMLKTADPSELRLIDFGYAYNINKSCEFIPRGTKEYYAPEVAEGLVGTFSDMWSFGVTLYYWLSGDVPFKGVKVEEIVTKAIYRKLDLESGVWENVSASCKDLLRNIFKAEPTSRLTAVQALSHPWITNARPLPLIPTLEIVEKLRKYQTGNKAKRIILRKLAQSVYIPNAVHLAEAFFFLDPVHSGAITVEGLKKVLNGSIAEIELQELVNKFESPIRPEYPQVCQITFSDFVAVMLGSELQRNISGVQFTFNLIDSMHTGCIKSSQLFFLSCLMGLCIKPTKVEESMQEQGDRLDFDGVMHLFSQNEGPDYESSTDSEGVIAVLQSEISRPRGGQARPNHLVLH